ncbi:hypothetical protein J5N97_022007 [Dioscorea zingiberensis]|uniref:Uncharacterized protein n=1 Tax=Dioscorea zingiberensis TaxID=325984 RepID=A0A9D5CB27_9LILI|nr:hypothetical protein J5N97_022007 [Dioscorea zingiberensis]
MAADQQTLAATGDLPAVPGRTPLLEGNDSQLAVALRRLERFLAVLGFHHASSPLSIILSCSAFLLLGIATPILCLYFSRCGSGCDKYQIERFELWVFFFEASLAGVSLGCVSRNLFKYGMRRFLFVDQHHGHVQRFQKEYVLRIQGFYHMLLWWMLPCFIAKAAREIIRFVYVHHGSMWKSVIFSLASIISWAYLTTIFLSACILFNLVCNLQVIHFEDYGNLLERDEEALIYLEEHVRLRYYLSKISHRFRIYLLLVFLFVTASQFVTLFQTTRYSEIVNFINAGDLAISSVVQVVGVVLCLNAAAKISHRAQGIASVASRWHALVTCTTVSDLSHSRVTNSSGNLEAFPPNTFLRDFSESDLESLDCLQVQTNTHLVSYMSSYHKRQALVLYLQTNLGGITIFGWTVDRALLNTLFFLELSLVLFVLGKTIVFSS